MAERDPLWLQGGNYTATEDRMALAALTGARWPVDLAVSTSPLTSAGGGHGVVGAGDLAVTADGAGMDVTIAAGMAMVRGTQQGDQGVYVVANDAAKTISISASDATNPRKDLVVIRVKDAEFGIAGDVTSIEIVTGTPTGGLTAGNATGRPTPPENALILAEVLVPAGATSNATFTITTDHTIRTRAAGLGGTVVCTSTTRPSSPTEGMRIVEIDTDRELIYTGSAWEQQGQYGPWSSYTPVITQGGTVTATVNRARYHRAGRKITGDVYATVTGGAGAPTTTIDVSLPVTPAATSGNTIAGEGWIFDASTNAFWFGTMLISSSGAVRFLRRQDGVTSAFLATSGMTSALAVGDILSFSFAYEAAS